MKKHKSQFNHFNQLLCNKIFCPVNLGRDLLILGLFIFLAALLIASNYYIFSIQKKTAQKSSAEAGTFSLLPISEEEVYQEVKATQETVDISSWKTYQNRWYGFELKHPADWNNPLAQRKVSTDQWTARYQFRQKNVSPESLFIGFDLSVYENSKISNLFQTAEFPAKKSNSEKTDEYCQNIVGHIIETGNYPAEEIYIGPDDDCYESTLFFSFIKGNYLYVLSPRFKDESQRSLVDPRVEITNSFPEFFSVTSTLSIIDIVRPKPVAVAPPKPKVNAPMPVSYKKVGERLVCAKKNDKPSKSNTNKKKHMDMECCLDPDEYPNPHCSYEAKKYQKYLK